MLLECVFPDAIGVRLDSWDTVSDDGIMTLVMASTQAEDIFELIGERHRSLSTMIASNRAPQDWYPLFPNPVLAEAALERLINRAHHLILEGRSYRPLLRPDRVSALAKETIPE